MPFCTECGHENPSSARFCAQCGHRLVSADGPTGSTATIATVGAQASAEAEGDTGELSAADVAALDALPAGSALLVVQRGPGAGSRYLLDTDVVSAGRHPDSDIFLDDVTVSRRHAEFRRGPEGYRVRDVGSLNGTYVNRDRIDEKTLNGRDEVQIGKYRLVYHPNASGAGGPGS